LETFPFHRARSRFETRFYSKLWALGGQDIVKSAAEIGAVQRISSAVMCT
jgi:hypothetical protein